MMQIITLETTDFAANIAALKTALDSISGYFSSTVIDDSGAYPVLNCYAGETVACSISPHSDSGYMRLNVTVYSANTTSYGTSGSSSQTNAMVGHVLETDNAVVLFVDSNYARPIIIAKNTAGTITVVFMINDRDQIAGISDATSFICATAAGSAPVFPAAFRTDEESGDVYGNPVFNVSGVVRDVLISPLSCYRSEPVPFRFAAGGKSYVGLQGNSFFIKSD